MIRTILLCLALAVPMVAQDDVVSKAKANLEAKHQKEMIAKAESLLQLKKNLEEELAKINSKLEQLAAGKDVKDEGAGFVSLGTPGSTIIIPCITCYGQR